MLHALDLFSGIGGFSYAFHGYIKTVLYSDISQDCRNTLRAIMERGHIDTAPINDDIHTITPELISTLEHKPDVIFAGFPCQDFSACNHKGRGLDGPRSKLFFEIIRLCDEVESVRHVILENVGKVVTSGMINRVRESFVSRGFFFSYVIIQAAQCGAPHLRRRCFMVASKDIEILQGIHPKYENQWASSVPDSMMKVVNNLHVIEARKRSGLCGNSIVPECVKVAFNSIVHSKPPPKNYRDYGVVLVDENLKFKCRKKRWGTPYASNHLYFKYNKLSPRSTTVLYNQIYYQDVNIDRRGDPWTIDPRFVEWMMGYPKDYTKKDLDAEVTSLTN